MLAPAPHAIPLTCIDLFAGAGGLSLGFEEAGFQTAVAVDSWLPAVDTYTCNFPEVPFLQADLRDLNAHDLLASSGLITAPTVVTGGPPCQGFSSAGRRESTDPRNTLVSVFARLVAELRPPFVMFENVEGFLTAGAGAAVVALLDPLVAAGYQIHLRKVNAANYAVPQLRKRVIAIGALGFEPPFPEITHTAYGAPGAHLAGVTYPPSPTLRDALSSLAPPGCAAAPRDHDVVPLSECDLERSHFLAAGDTMKSLPAHLRHPSYDRRAYRRVMDGTPSDKRGGAPAGLRRLHWDQPSKAITSAAVREFLHPDEHRFLTLRECARLQTFPDDFTFVGSKADKATLIGNAVPPRLSRKFGEALSEGFHRTVSPPGNGTGSLVSFLPTLSAGQSPLLNEVVAVIQSRYLRRPANTARQMILFDA